MEIDWNLSGSLLLFQGRAGGKKVASGTSADDGALYEGRSLSSYKNPAVRKLLNESHGIFHKLQNWVETNQQLGAEELIGISCPYRSILRSTCISLQESLQNAPVSSEAETLLDLYRSAELVWSLAELLFIRPPGGSVALDLVDWAAWNFTEADQWAAEILTESIQGALRPEDHQNYWDTVYQYTLFGRCSEAVKLLQTHSRKMEGAFRSVDELLRKIPFQSLGIDQNQWTDWQTEANRRLTDGHYTAYPELETIVKILCGDKSVLASLRSLAPTWYEVLVPLVLFKYSDAKLFDLQDVVQESFFISGCQMESVRPLDSILLALLELDILRALKELSAQATDWWLPAHLADLLYHAGCKDLQNSVGGLFHDQVSISKADSLVGSKSVSLREFLVLEYAQSLMNHSSLWQLGVCYLDACKMRGAKMLQLFLERLPLDSDAKAMKVIRVAEERGLKDVRGGVCRELAIRALKQNNLSVALGWCLESKDAGFATFMAEQCLQEYGRSGLLHGLHLLDQVGDTLILSPSLIFLGKYREFRKLYEDGKLKQAADLLYQMLKSRVAPRRFWVTLLLDALPMLDLENNVVFDKEQTYELMNIVETVSMEKRICKSEAFAKTDLERETLEEQLKHLRVGLVRNLGKAILCVSDEQQMI